MLHPSPIHEKKGKLQMDFVEILNCTEKMLVFIFGESEIEISPLKFAGGNYQVQVKKLVPLFLYESCIT